MIAPPSRSVATTRLIVPTTGSAVQTGDPGATEDGTPTSRLTDLVVRATTPEDEALEQQREEFDLVATAQAETEREINALRDMAMEQVKHDDELLKKWIELI